MTCGGRIFLFPGQQNIELPAHLRDVSNGGNSTILARFVQILH